jgi:peptide/nickel transport system substrate-binding protein
MRDEVARGFIFVCALMLALSACAKNPALAPSNYLQVDISVSPSTLDPRVATDAISERVVELIYDGLVKADRRGNFQGDLAATIDRPSPTVIVFHLRRGIHFSDGRELTAYDVKYTYDFVLDPASQSLKRAALKEMSSIQALDRYTIEMTTRRPYAPALAMATIGIVPAGSPLPGTRAAFVIPGTGPFRLVRFTRDEAIILSRNRYHPSEPETVNGIVIKVVPDATVRALELVEGICDFTENDGVQPDLIPYLTSHSDLSVEESPGTTFQYLIFNLRDTRLRDVRVRRAIALAINRQQIVESMLRGTARVATGILTPENWAYEDSVMRYSYEPAAARRMLEEAGYSANDRRLRFVYKTTPEGRRLAETLQAMLGEVGIRIEIRTNEWATFYSDLVHGNFDLASSQLVGVVDPHQYFSMCDSKEVPPRGMNRGAYSSAEMDRLVELGDSTIDPAIRRGIYDRVQQLAASDLPFVPLWWMDNVAAFNRRLVGFDPYPNGSLRSLAAATYQPGPLVHRFDD